jgi:hexosaminidase
MPSAVNSVMLRNRYIALLFLLFAFKATGQGQAGKNAGIIPAPVSVIMNQGLLDLRSIKAIVADHAGGDEAQLLHEFLLDHAKLDIPVVNKKAAGGINVISFSGDYNGKNSEGYRLVVTGKGISIAGREAGVFYGLQSLLQLLQAPREDLLHLPCVVIDDEPRYPYRGIMQDVGYHFFPVSFIKKEIDMISKYKMNVYHWHLTEDHGWRIEIKKYPKLTTVGSRRAQSPISNYEDRMTGMDHTPYGGFYTQKEIKEVVAYATARHVTIIPEIEMPGHSLAALAAYPELGCGDNPGPFKVAENWGIYDDVYCAGKEHTFEFLENVLSEVIDLFPGKYIHIGGDECPKDRWRKCKYCQQRIKDNHLKNEDQLQSYFISRIEKFVNSKGRTIIGWEEILEGGLAPNAVVMSWRGIEAGTQAAKQDHDVIMASESHLYFDFIQGPREQEPLAIGVGYNPLPRVYAFNPTPGDLTEAQQKHILGVEAPLWTEHMETAGNVEYMLFPRLFALAEVAWTPLSRKDYTDFTERRLPWHLFLLDKSGTVYRVPTPVGQRDTTLWGNEFTIALKPPVEGAVIYYNFEGQPPGEADYTYSIPLHIIVPEGEMRELKTIVVTPAGKRSIVTSTRFVNKPALAPKLIDQGSLSPGLRYFLIPGEYPLNKRIDTAAAKRTGVAKKMELEKFDRDSGYTVIYRGYVDLPADDIYTFSMPAKAANVIIDELPGVPNSTIYNPFDLTTYQYQERTLSYHLKKGWHAIEIRYKPVDAGDRILMANSTTGYRDFDELLFRK